MMRAGPPAPDQPGENRTSVQFVVTGRASCDPNCEAVEEYDDAGRLVLKFQTIMPVEVYPCHCGYKLPRHDARGCRGRLNSTRCATAALALGNAHSLSRLGWPTSEFVTP